MKDACWRSSYANNHHTSHAIRVIRVATVADCVQNPPRNGVACGRGFTVEHMSKGEQMQEQKMPVVAVVLAAGFGLSLIHI